MGRKYRVHFQSLALIFAIIAWFGATFSAAAQPPEVARGVVATVEEGGVLRLEDGRTVRPALLEVRPEVRDAAAGVVAGRVVSLHWPALRRDRHGRLLAQVVRDDGLWLQQALIGGGVARVVTFADETEGASALLVAEDAARRAGLGLWAEAENAPLPAADIAAVAARRGHFAVIEGRVKASALVRGRLYLNFGEDWRDDVTVSIAPAALKVFPKEQRDPVHWRGRLVRARGWVRDYNGPLIEADHPEVLETLSGK